VPKFDKSKREGGGEKAASAGPDRAGPRADRAGPGGFTEAVRVELLAVGSRVDE